MSKIDFPKRWSSVDIGTNTVLYLCADVAAPDDIRTVAEAQRIIRLGKNVDAQKNLQPAGLEKCVAVLKEYIGLDARHRSERLIAAGTSALRDAQNRDWFLSEVYQQTGVKIEILSGPEEALWTYQGGRLALRQTTDSLRTALVIDIGGGSTELILGGTEAIHHMTSIDIGAVRLTERFIRHDPLWPEEEANMRHFIQECLATHATGFRKTPTEVAIGVAGTVTTLAAMHQELTTYAPEKINGYILSRTALLDILQTLRHSVQEERKNLPGLEPARADVILAGTVILDEIMEHFKIAEILVSNYGLRYGLMIREYLKMARRV